MGDIISGIFGSSTATEQETIPDAFQREMNLQRLNQVVNLFATGRINQFAGERNDLYSINDTQRYINDLLRDSIGPTDTASQASIMGLDDYLNSFSGVRSNYDRSLSDVNNIANAGYTGNQGVYDTTRGYIGDRINQGLARSYGDYATGINTAGGAYDTATGDITAAYNAALARGDYDYARALLTNEYYANQSLGRQDYNRQRALDLGIGQTGNYVDQIATPRLKQALALQGLESGGAVPVAIARATAEQAMPYLQSIENTYAANQANTANALTALQGTLGQSTAEGNRALGSQRMQAQAQVANTYQNNVTQLAAALMANNITLEQAGISAESALGQGLITAQNNLRQQQLQSNTSLSNTYNTLSANFAQSLPQASSTLAQLPGQVQAQRTQNLTALAGLSDYERQLRQQDFLRRQDLFTSIYTGIPFQSGSTTIGGTATGNIFDQLGGTIQSGATGGGNIGGT